MVDTTNVAANLTASAKAATPTNWRLSSPPSRHATNSTDTIATGSVISTSYSVTSGRLTLTINPDQSAGKFVFEQLDIRVHHERHKLGKPHRRLPSEHSLSFRCVAAKMIHFGRSVVTRIDLHELLPFQSNVAEGVIKKL